MDRVRAAGLSLALFAPATTIPFVLLVDRFGYDDVLREPPLQVLAAFRDGGPELILIWLAFATCALGFLVVSSLVGSAVQASGGPWPTWAAAAGAGSALAQAAGLSRWPFVAPSLAETAAAGDPAAQVAAVTTYEALHQFAGVAIGEWLGQTLLALWTLALGVALVQGRPGPRILGWVGVALAPLWIVGQIELLATVHPAFPDLQLAQWTFTAWLAWVLAVGVWWTLRGGRAGLARTSAPT